MPEYNQGFGQSNKAASVTLTAPAAGAKITASADVTLKADAKDNDGSVKSVAFYVGNTLVGTSTTAPYQVTAKNLASGTHSAVAVVTDNSGLTWMSEYVTFTVEGSAESSSSVVTESSSSEAPVSSSAVAESSSSEVSSSSIAESSSSATPASSSSEGTIGIASPMQRATEAEAGFYRIFDIQGRPLYSGNSKPAKMPAAHVIVIEYSKTGKTLRHYIQ